MNRRKDLGKILLCGATGLLGKALLKEFNKRSIQIYTVARKNADFNVDIAHEASLKEILEQVSPDIIINAAAIVNLRYCEENPADAYLVNARPAAIIAEYASKKDKYMIQVSTDHFYADKSNIKHSENSSIQLLNEYARTKYAAEQYALLCPKSLVTRTNIVGFRNNMAQPTFVEWVLSSLHEKTHMKLFQDVYVSSMAASQFAHVLYDLLSRQATGVFNVSSSESFSKEAFIIELANRFELDLRHTTSSSQVEENGLKRSSSLGLEVTKVENYLGYKMPDLKEVIEQLYLDYKELIKDEL